MWLDSDLFFEKPEVDLDTLVERHPPVQCCAFGAQDSAPKVCKKCGLAEDAELWLASNFPWGDASPNCGFFILRRKGLAREMLAKWFHNQEREHNGVFEQHSLEEELREPIYKDDKLVGQGSWIAKHMAIMPLPAMTRQAIGKSPVRHLETSQRENRVPVLQAGLRASAMGAVDRTCGKVIDFNATAWAEVLFPIAKREALWDPLKPVDQPPKPGDIFPALQS